MSSPQSPALVLSPATPVWSAQHGIWSMAEEGQNWSDSGACCFSYLQCVEWNGVIQVPVASPLFSVEWNGVIQVPVASPLFSVLNGME